MGGAVENWKDVPGFEGRYRVSDLGRVYSSHCGRVLRPGPKSSGHLTVALGRGNSRQVHDLVLRVFVGPPAPGQECLHGDDDQANNCLSNLRWGTRSENLKMRIHNKGVRGRPLRVEDVRAIKASGFGSLTKLALQYGVSRKSISNIRDGRCHVDV